MMAQGLRMFPDRRPLVQGKLNPLRNHANGPETAFEEV
jgi:hypothetical protein